MHFQPGVAQYSAMEGKDGKPLMVYINEETAKKMDQTFPGKPVFVNHKVEFSEEEFQSADGYVSESFFNKSDGNHWVKFIVTTEKGFKAIKDGYRLSNCYKPIKKGKSGSWHGVDYDYKVLNGDYEHLALVKNPRYEESTILNPEQFKKYNEGKEKDLEKLQNEKSGQRLFFIKNVDPESEDLEKKKNKKKKKNSMKATPKQPSARMQNKKKRNACKVKVKAKESGYEKKRNSLKNQAMKIMVEELKKIRKKVA